MSDKTCIICNKSFKRLSSHVRAHGLTISQYNEKKAVTIPAGSGFGNTTTVAPPLQLSQKTPIAVDVTKATYDTQHRRHNQFERCANKCNCPHERLCTANCKYWSHNASIVNIDS